MKDTPTQEASAEDIVDKQLYKPVKATLLLLLLYFVFGMCHQINKMSGFKVRRHHLIQPTNSIHPPQRVFTAVMKLASRFVQ